MMHIEARAVRSEAVESFGSLSEDMAKDFEHLRPFGRTASFGWQTQDLNSKGACGDAALASAKLGKTLLDTAAATLAEVLQEIDRVSPDVLKTKDRP